MQALILIAGTFVTLIIGLVFGKLAEKKHFRRLNEREAALGDIVRCNLKTLPRGWALGETFLVMGSAVIATDYFKTFAAGLRGIFGGEIRGYRTLMNRARREAMVRMLEQAKGWDANIVWNIRFETVTIQGKRKPGGVEVLAYGTAVKRG